MNGRVLMALSCNGHVGAVVFVRPRAGVQSRSTWCLPSGLSRHDLRGSEDLGAETKLQNGGNTVSIRRILIWSARRPFQKAGYHSDRRVYRVERKKKRKRRGVEKENSRDSKKITGQLRLGWRGGKRRSDASRIGHCPGPMVALLQSHIHTQTRCHFHPLHESCNFFSMVAQEQKKKG